ncbi:MAG: serine/threonine-protein kinase [Jaaginema sp. PMC 1079.18]|nr:serine/threonine-protein kinase [Jaaginema sp. PMC 1080.18]MEC4850826.1 serine/threonine-protein kinase [Jaaginema sp. PMC 1079.18]MEC4868376.1 serine/threonine-protein kinase [Jaaginema sp. PMC 1078.18]
MSLCINPHCSNPNHPGNARHRHCQSCHADLVIHKRYRIGRLLSDTTGFGKIYEARDRHQAKILKVLKIDDPKAIALFQQEAEVLGQLHHPGIPQIDAYFTWQPQTSAKPLHCIVMEKIQGQNLQTWMQDKNAIAYEQALDWLQQLIEILDCVHQKQYFHRDIKPANIMRRPDGRLTLIDFGTAREMTHTYLAKMGSGSGVTSIASAGYTPLEQNNGKAVPQSDFYALGRTFVFLLTGKVPTAFDEDPRTGQLMWQAASSHLPPNFVALIDRMMAPFPGNRPPNTEAIATQLKYLEAIARNPDFNPEDLGNPAQMTATVPLFLQKSPSQPVSAIPAHTASSSVSLDTPPIQLDVSLPSVTQTLTNAVKGIPSSWWKTGGAIAIALMGAYWFASWLNNRSPAESPITLRDIVPEFQFELPPEPLNTSLPVPTPPSVAEPVPLNLSAQNNGVTLQVLGLREEQNNYILEIALQNSNPQAVEFLSSFFTITDDRGLAVSATVEGIPERLPGNSPLQKGNLYISSGLLIGAQSVTLNVSDTEDRVQLIIPNIPLQTTITPNLDNTDLSPSPSEANTAPLEG